VAYKLEPDPENLHNSNSWSDGSQIEQKLQTSKGKKTERVNCNAVLEKLFGKWKRTTKLIERNYLL